MATTFSQQIEALATQIGIDVKSVNGKIGDLSALTPTQKANIVVAINQLHAELLKIDVSSVIDDSQELTTKTFSSKKISTVIAEKCAALKSEILGGAGTAFDTLQELATLIETNKDAIDALKSLSAGHVRFDQAQSLTTQEKANARQNIGAADADVIGNNTTLQTTAKVLVDAINEVKGTADQAKNDASQARTDATSAKSTVDTLKTSIGDTQKNFVEIYTAARDGV